MCANSHSQCHEIAIKMTHCWLCAGPAGLACEKCEKISCSTSHFDLHKSHDEVKECFPLEVVHSGTHYGRYLRTKKLFQAGEVILKDEPILFGPWNQEACMTCLNLAENNNFLKFVA